MGDPSGVAWTCSLPTSRIGVELRGVCRALNPANPHPVRFHRRVSLQVPDRAIRGGVHSHDKLAQGDVRQGPWSSRSRRVALPEPARASSKRTSPRRASSSGPRRHRPSTGVTTVIRCRPPPGSIANPGDHQAVDRVRGGAGVRARRRAYQPARIRPRGRAHERGGAATVCTASGSAAGIVATSRSGGVCGKWGRWWRDIMATAGTNTPTRRVSQVAGRVSSSRRITPPWWDPPRETQLRVADKRTTERRRSSSGSTNTWRASSARAHIRTIRRQRVKSEDETRKDGAFAHVPAGSSIRRIVNPSAF